MVNGTIGSPDREAIWRILVDEVRHRKTVLAMLRRFGWGPDRRAERKLRGVGKTISVMCHLGGWFLPMYGAARLEAEIDSLNESLQPLSSFILPGGSPAAAWLHLGRTVVRRAERRMTELAAEEVVNEPAMRYINRLSDHLFVLARTLNDGGKTDVLWRPGQNSGQN